MASTSLSCKGRKDVCSNPSVITSEPRSISELPDEILLNILSYFGPEELIVLIAPVCERWNDLAKDVVLWQTLTYTCDEDSEISVIEEVLTNAPALHSLIIRDRNEDADDILEFLFDKRVPLRRLTPNFGWIVGEYVLTATFEDLYPDLEILSLEDCYSPESASFGSITRLKKLSELHLLNCQGFSGETVRLIADSCQQLKKLSLLGCPKISDEDIIHVIDRLGKQLTYLVLDAIYLTDVAYLYLKNCARLQELDVSCLNMTDRGLLEGIGSLQELTSLSLGFCTNVTAQAFSTFFHRPSMTSIVLLELSYCPNLDDEGFNGIAERCIHLKELAVRRDCNVSDAGVSMVISHCSQLRVLNLMGMESITGEGWLTVVPSHLPHLRELCLDGCDVCYKYEIELRSAVPELKFNR